METKKTENCMICGEELAYLTKAIPVNCIYCGNTESANIHCPSGHYVCNECHASDSIKIITQFCLSSNSKKPDGNGKNHNEASHYANAWA